MDDLVVLKTYIQRYEAEYAQELLKNEGIESIVSGDDLGGTFFSLSRDKYRLMVQEENIGKAKQVLEIND